jgi:hypothetical protein
MKIVTWISAALFLTGTALSLRAATQGLLPAVVATALEFGAVKVRNALRRYR